MAANTHSASDFSFEPFARHEFYREVNKHLVDVALGFLSKLDPAMPRLIVDLGCGTGAITKLVVEKVQRLGQKAQIVGVDPSPLALSKARQNVTSAMVKFIQGSAENLSQLVSNADAVLFCNAIHLIDDKRAVIEEISRAVKSGGVAAFNSTFFRGCYLPITEKANRLWIIRAMQKLRADYPEVKIVKEAKTVAMRWLSPEEYKALLEESGFQVTHLESQQVEMTQQSMEDISEYSLFITGALPGVPLEVGAAVLKHGIREAIRELQLRTIPRYWLHIVAQKA